MDIVTIKNEIEFIWNSIDNWMNSGEKLISSEKSVVFNFAWEFQKRFQGQISLIDFETSLFDSFSDGQFLDLFVKLGNSGVNDVKLGFEFKYPNKKISNSNQTVTRQKIINDIKRLNWLVANNKIDMGCFLCVTNENGYVNYGKFKVAESFLTHHGHSFKADMFLPENEIFTEKVRAVTDIKFDWNNVALYGSKHVIQNSKYAFLKPIIITK